jgi:hypothetical protein
MKTDELISLLATNAQPVPSHVVGRRFAIALGMGLPLATVLMLVTLGLRPDMADAATQLAFWMKLAFAACLAVAGLVATERLSRPGVPVGFSWAAMAAPVLALWLTAAIALLRAAPEQRMDLILGDTWAYCPFNIAMLSVPLFAATFWCMKDLAPTRLALAGASSGLLSGALSALVYALHCPESTAPFLGVWYVLGIAIPTAAGALLGPRVLRW